MTERQDPVEWSREQWEAHRQPGADQFTAMVAILRTHQAMTALIDATLRTYDLTRTGYLLMTTLQLSRDGTRPLGQLSRPLMVHPTTSRWPWTSWRSGTWSSAARTDRPAHDPGRADPGRARAARQGDQGAGRRRLRLAGVDVACPAAWSKCSARRGRASGRTGPR